MADSDDDEYVEAMSEDEEGAPQPNGYKTRRGGNTVEGSNSGPSSRAQAGGRERWEDVQRSWDTVTEGADGSLAGAVDGLVEAGKRQRLLRDTTPFQRGIIRHTMIIIDDSSNMSEKDYRPTRHLLALRTAADFVNAYFEQNPISQLGILVTRDGICKRVTDMSGNPAEHTTALQELQKQDPSGQPSLQNSLELARASLAAAPTHGTKEIILVYGALLTADPGDIHSTIAALVQERIRVSVVGLAARMAILTELVARTHGLPAKSSAQTSNDTLYGVSLHENHFRTLLMHHTTPPAVSAAEQKARAPRLLPMGFPSRVEEKHASFCACHQRVTRGGYLCTRCEAKVCALPIRCPTCSLQLVQSTHLARSYHHLFPLRNFVEVSWAQARERGEDSVRCYGCMLAFPPLPEHGDQSSGSNGVKAQSRQKQEVASNGGASESSRYACTACGNHFCIDCDLYTHEVIHNCPGCLCKPSDALARKRRLDLAAEQDANGVTA